MIEKAGGKVAYVVTTKRLTNQQFSIQTSALLTDAVQVVFRGRDLIDLVKFGGVAFFIGLCYKVGDEAHRPGRAID